MKYPAPFILCCLEGKAEAAAAVALETDVGHASAAFVNETVRAAMGFLSSAAAPPRVAPVVLLAQQSLRSMLLARRCLALACLTPVMLAVVGSSAFSSPPHTTQAKKEAVRDSPPVKMDFYGDPLPPGAVARLGSLRLRHDSYIVSVAWSADGKLLAAASWWGDVRIWNSDTGRLVRQHKTGRGSGLVFSGAASKLACVGDRGIFTLWDENTGKELFQKKGHEGTIHALAFSPSGDVLASAGNDGFVRIWDAATGAERCALLTEKRGSNSFTRPVAISPDSRIVASAVGQRVFLWDLKSGNHLRTIDAGPRRDITSLGFIDSQTLATAGTRYQLEKLGKTEVAHHTGEAFIWNIGTGTVVRELKAGNSDGGGSMALSPDRKVLAISHHDRLRLWSVADGKLIREITGYVNRRSAGAHGLAFSPDGRRLAAAVGDNAVRCWDWRTSRPLLTFADAHGDWVCGAEFSADGRQAFTASLDGTIRVWETATAQLTGTLSLGNGRESSTAFSVVLAPDGKTVAASGDLLQWSPPGPNIGRVKVWNRTTGRQLACFSWPNQRIGPLAFAPDSTLLAVAADGDADPAGPPRQGTGMVIHLCNPANGRVERDLRGFAGAVRSLLFDSQGKKLIAIDEGGFVRLWDMRSGKQIAQFRFEPFYFSELAVSSLANFFAETDYSRSRVILRDLPAAQTRFAFDVKNLMQGGGLLHCPRLAFSADGRRLATLSYRHIPPGDPAPCTIRIWETLTGKEISAYKPGGTDWATSLCFSADGTRLISGMTNGTAFIWDLVGSRSAGTLVDASQIEHLWRDLGSTKAGLAHKAMWRLAGAAQVTVPFLRERLLPAAAADAKRTAKLVTDLGSDSFRIRQEATAELEKLADLAEPALRKVLQETPPEETRRRIEVILKSLAGPIGDPVTLRTLRAVEVLERAGTLDARRLLQRLARGTPEARLTQEARRALARLER